jgi:hypothetical protein
VYPAKDHVLSREPRCLAGMLVTADAMHMQKETARYLVPAVIAAAAAATGTLRCCIM